MKKWGHSMKAQGHKNILQMYLAWKYCKIIQLDNKKRVEHFKTLCRIQIKAKKVYFSIEK